jgi:hypothetical protein
MDGLPFVEVPSYTILCDEYEGLARHWEVKMYYSRWWLALTLILFHTTGSDVLRAFYACFQPT